MNVPFHIRYIDMSINTSKKVIVYIRIKNYFLYNVISDQIHFNLSPFGTITNSSKSKNHWAKSASKAAGTAP